MFRKILLLCLLLLSIFGIIYSSHVLKAADTNELIYNRYKKYFNKNTPVKVLELSKPVSVSSKFTTQSSLCDEIRVEENRIRATHTVISYTNQYSSILPEALCLINEEREKQGFERLSWESRLQEASSLHAYDMARNNYFDHRSLDGSLPQDRIEAAGYTQFSLIGENVALGQRTPERAFNAWLASENHRNNILDPVFRDTGLGMMKGKSGAYWVQTFGVERE